MAPCVAAEVAREGAALSVRIAAEVDPHVPAKIARQGAAADVRVATETAPAFPSAGPPPQACALSPKHDEEAEGHARRRRGRAT